MELDRGLSDTTRAGGYVARSASVRELGPGPPARGTQRSALRPLTPDAAARTRGPAASMTSSPLTSGPFPERAELAQDPELVEVRPVLDDATVGDP
jgi:hypothetical protein